MRKKTARFSPDEFERFKTEIDLRQYAASFGYVEDLRQSWGASTVMRSPQDDKITVTQFDNGHWVFFSNHFAGFQGSILNFCASMKGLPNCKGENFRIIADSLRAFMGEPPRDLPTFKPQKKITRDRGAALAGFEGSRVALDVPCLTARGIAPDILRRPEFAGCVRIDARRNAIFGHYDKDGLCGFEMKNRDFTGYSSGGLKGLWFSKAPDDQQAVVFTESAIDALSYAALHPDLKARYFSTGGNMNPNQPELIRATLEKLPRGVVVVLAFDADEGGDKLADQVRDIVPLEFDHTLQATKKDLTSPANMPLLKKPVLEVRRDTPPDGLKDWNDALKVARGIMETGPTIGGKMQSTLSPILSPCDAPYKSRLPVHQKP